MDIKDAESKLDQADSFLDKLKKVLRKNWGILTLILLGYGVYQFCVLYAEVMEQPEVEQVQSGPVEVFDNGIVSDTVWYEDGTYSIGS